MKVRGLLSLLLIGLNNDNNPMTCIYMKTTGLALRFFDCFHNTKLNEHTAQPLFVCPAELQGLEANVRRFENTRLSRQRECQPIFFRPLAAETNANISVGKPSVAAIAPTDWINIMAKYVATTAIASMQQTVSQQVSFFEPVNTNMDYVDARLDNRVAASAFDARWIVQCGGPSTDTPLTIMDVIGCAHCGMTIHTNHRFCRFCGGANH